MCFYILSRCVCSTFLFLCFRVDFERKGWQLHDEDENENLVDHPYGYTPKLTNAATEEEMERCEWEKQAMEEIKSGKWRKQ